MALPTDPISYIDTVASPFLISLKNDEPKLLKEGDGFISENESKADARKPKDSPPRPYPAPVMPNTCFVRAPSALSLWDTGRKGIFCNVRRLHASVLEVRGINR
jgi:hypothetical protein